MALSTISFRASLSSLVVSHIFTKLFLDSSFNSQRGSRPTIRYRDRFAAPCIQTARARIASHREQFFPMAVIVRLN